MKKPLGSKFLAFVLSIILVSGCSPTFAPIPPTFTTLPTPEPTRTPSSTPEPSPTLTPTPTVTPPPKPLLIRGLYVQFERRGSGEGYYSGEVISNFNTYDSVVGHTVAEEVSLQLDAMKQMGVNAITFELRAADDHRDDFPYCGIPRKLGLKYPQPTKTEISNLIKFFDLVQSKGIKILLRLVNTHMEEQPPTNNTLWLGTILNAIKNHPALGLVLFEGDTHLRDINGDGISDTCGDPAEPPLWMGPMANPAKYVKWAIDYGHSLGLPYRKLSAEAIIGISYFDKNPPAGPDATDNHFWNAIRVLKLILDDLSIPDDQRTYAVSFYERRKCPTDLTCKDTDPNAWADETLRNLYDTIGRENGARVVAVEMGVSEPVEASWSSAQALESLVLLFKTYGVEGGCFWRWTSFNNDEDKNPELADPIKKRGIDFIYNPVKDTLVKLYTMP